MKCPKCGYSSIYWKDFRWEEFRMSGLPAYRDFAITCPKCGYRQGIHFEKWIPKMFKDWFDEGVQ